MYNKTCFTIHIRDFGCKNKRGKTTGTNRDTNVLMVYIGMAL